MGILIGELLVYIINTAIDEANFFLEKLAQIVFYADEFILSNLDLDLMSQNLNDYFLAFGALLIILKFLKKGFSQYILYTEGDSDSDVLILFTNFLKAFAIAVSFPYLYKLLADVAMEMTQTTMGILDYGIDYGFINVANLNIFKGIISIIYFICFFILYIKFLERGLELFILKIGMPIACTGIMEADGGVFKPYVEMFFKAVFTTLVQLALIRLSIVFMKNYHMFWALASLITALKTPQLLENILLPSKAGSNITMKAYYSMQMSRMIKAYMR